MKEKIEICSFSRNGETSAKVYVERDTKKGNEKLNIDRMHTEKNANKSK